MSYLRIENGVAVEEFSPDEGFEISQYFPPEIASQFVAKKGEATVGWKYKNGKFSPPDEISTPLADVVASLKRQTDSRAEAERLRYITPGAGQALTYMQKSDEARRYLASSDPVDADFPLLAAEVGITAPDIHGVATIVSAAFGQWQQIGASIEAARLGGKALIEAAETASDAQAAFDAIVWPGA